MSLEANRLDLGELRSRLVADDKDPWIRVSTVAEYVFCPRAGLLTHESELEDRGEEEPTFDILLRYEKEAIETDLWKRLGYLLSLLSLFFLIVVVAVLFIPDHWRWASDPVAFLVLVIISCFCFQFTRQLVILSWRRHQTRGRVAREPDPDLLEIQQVDWWELLESKFDSTKDKELKNGDFRLRGRPMRVLKRGDIAVPVFRTRSEQTEPRPQQIVRVMGYCVLLGLEYGHVPYGIILFGKSYKGVAVPNVERCRGQFYEALLAVRKMVRSSVEDNLLPGIPRNTKRCSGCPLGCPRKLFKMQPTMCYDEKLEPYVVKDKYKRPFHSDCGDRFGWVPPHKDKKRLDLGG